jgi:UPF0716 protein FxsA
VILIAALLLLVAFGVVELWSMLAFANWIGWGPTLLLLVGAAVLGVYLVRREGLSAMRRANAEMASGRMPTGSLVDGALILIGGCCLIVPGFVSDLFGLVLLVPPTRAFLRRGVERWMERRVTAVGMVNSIHIGGLGDPFGGGGAGWNAAPGRNGGAGWNGAPGWIDADGSVRRDGDEVAEATAEVIDVEVHRPLELGPPES